MPQIVREVLNVRGSFLPTRRHAIGIFRLGQRPTTTTPTTTTTTPTKTQTTTKKNNSNTAEMKERKKENKNQRKRKEDVAKQIVPRGIPGTPRWTWEVSAGQINADNRSVGVDFLSLLSSPLLHCIFPRVFRCFP